MKLRPCLMMGTTMSGGAKLDDGQKKFNATTSMFFDGSSDYLSVVDTSGTDYDVAGSLTDSWTIDTWFRSSDLNINNTIFEQADSSPATTNRWMLFVSNTGFVRWMCRQTAGILWLAESATSLIVEDTWYHIAAVKSGTNIGVYIDGVQVGFDTQVGTDTFTGSLYSGVSISQIATNPYYMDGYLEQVQITKGNKFGVVPMPEPFSHMKMENNTDDGSGANAVTNIGTPTYTAGKLNNALTLNGTDQALNVDALQADIEADTTGSFTAWIYKDATTGTLFSIGDTVGTNSTFLIELTSAGRVYCSTKDTGAGSMNVNTATSSFAANTWTHIAIVQDGVEIKIYVNAVSQSLTFTAGGSQWLADANASLVDNGRIGCQNRNSSGNIEWYAGQIDDFRYYQAQALTDQQVEAIYNGGTGTEATYPLQITVPTAVLTQDTITEPTEEYSPDTNLVRSQAVIIA